MGEWHDYSRDNGGHIHGIINNRYLRSKDISHAHGIDSEQKALAITPGPRTIYQGD